MTTKEYLNQISKLNRMINHKISELSELKELSYSISAVTNEERVQTTPNFDKIGSAYVKIEEMEERINALIDEYVDKKYCIVNQIENIEDETLCELLFSKYIEKKSFEKIADEIGYSFRNTTRLHGKALQEFEKKYGEYYRLS